jgi:hypothetical protein
MKKHIIFYLVDHPVLEIEQIYINNAIINTNDNYTTTNPNPK